MVFDSFTPVAPIPEATLQRFAGQVPEAVTQAWREHGAGFVGDGYFRLVDPARAQAMLGEDSPLPPDAVVVFTTGMADLTDPPHSAGQLTDAARMLGRMRRNRHPHLPKTTHKRLVLLHRQPIPTHDRLRRIQDQKQRPLHQSKRPINTPQEHADGISHPLFQPTEIGSRQFHQIARRISYGKHLPRSVIYDREIFNRQRRDLGQQGINIRPRLGIYRHQPS